MSEWRTIDSAPKNEKCLVWFSDIFGGLVDIAQYSFDEYATHPKPYWRGNLERLYGVKAFRLGKPTHWMPLPPPPQETTSNT